MWATGMWSFAAVRAAARVEFVSPGTITRSGFCFCKIQKASQVLSVIDRMEFYGNLEQKYFLQCLQKANWVVF